MPSPQTDFSHMNTLRALARAPIQDGEPIEVSWHQGYPTIIVMPKEGRAYRLNWPMNDDEWRLGSGWP